MDEIGKMLAGSGPVSFAVAIALALIGLAAGIPKLLNNFKAEQLSGNVLDRIRELEKKSDEQDKKIHKFAIKVTKLAVVVIRLEALLSDNKISIPPDLMAEIQALQRDPEND